MHTALRLVTKEFVSCAVRRRINNYAPTLAKRTAGSLVAFSTGATVALFARKNLISSSCHCSTNVHLNNLQHLPQGPTIAGGDHQGIDQHQSSSSANQRANYGFFGRLYWTVRLTFRAVRLMVSFAPVFALYPLMVWTAKTRRLWMSMLMFVVQRSGPTLIKMGQWASTRRDIFSAEFCDQFAVLTRRTGRRPWKETAKVLDEAFGPNVWINIFNDLNREAIGSGCIAQVYKAQVNPSKFTSITGIELPDFPADECIPVAIKVAQPSVLYQIRMDLGIVGFFASALRLVAPSMRLVDPVTCLEQFQRVLEKQVDLRHEGRALERFGRNFDPSTSSVRFPIPLCYTENLLVETYEPGVHVGSLVSDSRDKHHIDASPELKSMIALTGVRALLKMIFVDNFIHGDLHPGNILVRLSDFGDFLEEYSSDDSGPILIVDTDRLESAAKSEKLSPLSKMIKRVKDALQLGSSIAGDVRFIDVTNADVVPSVGRLDPTLVFLDTGITVEQEPYGVSRLKAVFKAVVEDDGYKVGDLLLTQGPEQPCLRKEEFKLEVASIVHKAVTETASLKHLNISSLLSQLFSSVSRHQVILEPSFSVVVLAVMVLEGLGRSLDPNINLFHCARPYLV